MGRNSAFLLTLALWSVAVANGYEVVLSHLSTVYVPGSYVGNQPDFSFQSDAVEKAVYEPAGRIIYAIGEKIFHVINASDPMTLTYLYHVMLDGKELTDVELCADAVFVTYADNNNVLQGGVLQFSLYSTQRQSVQQIRDIEIPNSSQPDMVTATKDCTLVVALENPAVMVNGQFRDPPGGVGIIRFPQGLSGNPVLTTLGFTYFDPRADRLMRSGVRWPYRASNFSDDLEPEYVSLNSNQTKAYVGLQENNAVAVVDLATNTITDLYGLGYKVWSQEKIDPSDSDGGIKLASWQLYGMYQPDELQCFRWNGQDYVITANEGSSKDYEEVNFEESKRGRDFTDQEISPQMSEDLKQALRDDAKLGRLQLSSVETNVDRQLDKLYTFGARSFSIWRASDMVQVYDSGSELSEKVAQLRPDLFNNDVGGRNERVADGMDKRSDDKGPEPESVTVAEVQGHLIIFVGLERPGGIAVYSVAPGNDLKPRFESLYTGGIPRDDRTWGQMYDAKDLHAVGPEYLGFIPANSEEGRDYPMLLVTGVESGTVSLLRVHLKDFPTGESSRITGAVFPVLMALLMAMIFMS